MAERRIFFGTNRAVTAAEDGTIDFGDDLAPRYQARPYLYRVGTARVTRRGEPWGLQGEAYRMTAAELTEEVAPTLDQPDGVPGSRTLFETMRRTMADDPRDTLVFIHGFASTFASAMERAAELTDAYLSPDTDPATGGLTRGARAPLAFAFAWPSDGEVLFGDDANSGWAYSGDREDARASGLAMARCALRLFDFLAELRTGTRCHQRLHLVAHSMGNWALRHAAQALADIAAAQGRPLAPVFDHAFLMGADIEADALERGRWLAPLLDIARRVHVYHAENDRALTLSDWKPNQGARLGHLGPARMAALPDRVSAVDCAAVSDTPADRVRHQYYRLAPEVPRDVRAVLAGKPVEAMRWRRPNGTPGRWRLARDAAAREALAAQP